MKADLSRCYETRRTIKEYKLWRNSYIMKLYSEVWSMSDHELEIRFSIHKNDTDILKILKPQKKLRDELKGKFFQYQHL